jgi:hypothetical protein
MALVVKDRVQENSTTSGTGTLTLSGAVPGFQSFAVIGNGNTTFYTIYDNVAQVWEVGVGTYTSSGTTLSRDTVLSNSSGTTSPITLAGNTVSVFVTYPAEKSVNLNASGNVSPLGTISSGTWQGSTIGVAYGGTGVTTSSGANSVMLRDANQNVAVNRLNQSNTNTTAAGGVTALTTASSYIHTLSGTGNQTYTMPDATTLSTGVAFLFNNMATGTLTLQDYATGPIGTIPSGGAGAVFLTVNATVGGTWDLHAYLPEGVTFGTNAFNLGTSVITGGTWNGGTIGTAYGGTGLTSFSAANYALYSTSSSALTAGTLPVAAGGTNVTSFTANGIVYGNGTSALGVTAAGATGEVLIGNTGSAPTWGALSGSAVTTFQTSLNGLTPSTATSGAVTLAGTLGTTSGGTGLTSYTTGDIIYASATNTLAKLPAGTNGQILSLASGIPSWITNTSTGVSFVVTNITASASQTTFTVTYTVGLIEVYRNGVKLAIADYTASNGTTIVLATPANAGDVIEVVAFGAVNTAAVITAEDFNGTGSQTVYTMSVTPANSASVIIAISGVVQDPSTYTVSGTTLTFSTAPPAGTDNISCRYLALPTTTTGTGAVINATNGIIINNQTISASYTIPVGSNAMSTGPVTAASGVTVTVSAGSRYIVI